MRSIKKLFILLFLGSFSAVHANPENCLNLIKGKDVKTLSPPKPKFKLKWNNEDTVDCIITGSMELSLGELTIGETASYELNCNEKKIGVNLFEACEVDGWKTGGNFCGGFFYVWPKNYNDYFEDRYKIKIMPIHFKKHNAKLSCNEDASIVILKHTRMMPGIVEGTNNSVVIFSEHFGKYEISEKEETIYEF